VVTRERLVVAGLLLFTALGRGGVLWGMRGNLQQDPDAYREIAENVLVHGVYGLGKAEAVSDPFAAKPLQPTAYRPPLYPILLSNLPAQDGKHVSLVLVAVVHVLLGVATVWLTYLTARCMVDSSRREEPAAESTSVAARVPHGVRDLLRPGLAGLLVACDPILLNQQTLVMTETLATFLAILALWCLIRVGGATRLALANGTRNVPTTDWWNAGLAGGAIGLGALCRPTFLPWLGLVAVAMVIADFGFQISDWKSRGLRATANVSALVVVAAAVMSPWAYRNYKEFGKPILTTTHGGYTLALGNNESFYAWLAKPVSDIPWDSAHFDIDLHIATVFRTLDSWPSEPKIYEPWEETKDVVAYDRARAAMRENPRMFVVACLYRVRQLWSPLPHKLTADESTGRRLMRYATAAWYCGVYALAAVGIWRLRSRIFRAPWVWGVMLCLAFTAVHTLYWCNLRMRAPLMPFVALVAGAALLPTRSVSEAVRDPSQASPH